MTQDKQLNINQILNYLPHRYPFLLVDKVLDYVPHQSLRAVKNITYNEPMFSGHFPQRPIMPGVLIIEALAQATGILAFVSGDDKTDDEMFYLVGIDKARFKQPVEPGDQLILDVQLHRVKRGIGVFTGTARVNESVVASAELMCARRGIDI